MSKMFELSMEQCKLVSGGDGGSISSSGGRDGGGISSSGGRTDSEEPDDGLSRGPMLGSGN
jgi:hypothetical protein